MMEAIGLDPIKLDAIGLDPIRMNAIRLGVPGASLGSSRPYIDPELLSHVKMAISTWGKTNEDVDRAILKDLSGNGNDMRLLNFGFAGNSGYGLYEEYFNSKWTIHPAQTGIVKNDTSIKIVGKLTNDYLIFHTRNQSNNAFRIKVTGIKGAIKYTYIVDSNDNETLYINSDGIYDLPASNSLEGNSNSIGFYLGSIRDVDLDWNGFSIEIIPDFEGWLCTDGVDDLIKSVKPVSEMLEGSNEFTVISIIHYINTNGEIITVSNNFIGDLGGKGVYARNTFSASKTNKTGIYGYSYNIPGRRKTVIGILGDEKDYNVTDGVNVNCMDEFTVNGFRYSDLSVKEVSQIAYAGGFLADKVLTTDEINQIIAYFNLDRPGQIIKPQLYCNIKKQGITNDNHAEFNDQLVDYINGHNIQLNNVVWEGESGINSYPVVFGNNKTWTTLRSNSNNANYEVTPNIIKVYKSDNAAAFLYSYVYNNGGVRSYNIPSFKLKIIGLKEGQSIAYKYVSESDKTKVSTITIVKDDIYDMPRSYPIEPNENTPNGTWIGFITTNRVDDYNLTLEVLPTIENALCLEGISDFGKATGLPVLKDYTVVADRGILGNNEGGTLSKSYAADAGSFVFETGSVNYSFGAGNQGVTQSKRMLSYLSKYVYNGNPIQAGTGVDSDSIWLGTIRDGDSRFSKIALWSLMLFPYSLSEFLLERQLRKYKAGTLYPDMVEWRPIVKSNIPYSSITYSVNPGEYVTEGSTVTITITLSNETDKLVGVSSNAISDISISGDNGTYEITGKVTKSPQKINMVISSYLTMLGNDTLISNETLIKNE